MYLHNANNDINPLIHSKPGTNLLILDIMNLPSMVFNLTTMVKPQVAS